LQETQTAQKKNILPFSPGESLTTMKPIHEALADWYLLFLEQKQAHENEMRHEESFK
jgi:hypothetical protein